MKKAFAIIALAALMVGLTGCGSLRTPDSGKNKGNVYYHTFFGLSIESGAYGDGFLVK